MLFASNPNTFFDIVMLNRHVNSIHCNHFCYIVRVTFLFCIKLILEIYLIVSNIFPSTKSKIFSRLAKTLQKGFIFAHVNLKCICWRVFQPFLVNHQSVFLRRRCANKMIDILRNSPKICFACLLLAKWSRRNFWFLCIRRSFITSAYHIYIL